MLPYGSQSRHGHCGIHPGRRRFSEVHQHCGLGGMGYGLQCGKCRSIERYPPWNRRDPCGRGFPGIGCGSDVCGDIRRRFRGDGCGPGDKEDRGGCRENARGKCLCIESQIYVRIPGRSAGILEM